MSVYKRGPHSWYIDIVLGGLRIHRKAAETRRAAVDIETELKDKFRRGLLSVDQLQRKRYFPGVAEEYLKQCKDINSLRTYGLEVGDYEKHLKPFFGDMVISDIDTAMLRKFQGVQKRRGYANRTINIHVGLVRKVRRFADEKGYTTYNRNLKFPMLPEPHHKHDFLSPAEYRKLIEHFTPEGHMALKRLIFGRHTGLRPQELTFLSWNDVDRELRTARIRSKPQYGYRVKKDTERIVPLNDEAIKIIGDLWESHKGPWVFSLTADPVKDIRTALATASRRAGIKKVTQNMIRHTFATHTLMAGGDVGALQRLMGHSSLETTNLYVGAVDEHLRATVDKLSTLDREPPPTKSPHPKKKGSG